LLRHVDFIFFEAAMLMMIQLLLFAASRCDIISRIR